MARTIRLTAYLRLGVVVILPAEEVYGTIDDSQREVGPVEFALNQSFDADNAPEPTGVVSVLVTIPATPFIVTIDFTDVLEVAASVASDLTGKRLMGFQFETGEANAAVVTVGPAAANGYALFGTGKDIDLPAACNIAMLAQDGSLPEISATECNLQFEGSVEADTVNVLLLFQD